MALPNPLPAVQGSRLLLGPDGGWQDTFLIVPGTSDYVTGGYAITNTACRLKNIQTAWISGQNATTVATAGGWYAFCVFPIVQMGAVSTGAGFTGYSQFLFKVYVSTTGVEVASGGSLAGNVWMVTVQGY